MCVPSRMNADSFTLDGEHDTQTGWLYTFTLQEGGTHHELTLSWVDHEHLVGGAIAPEHVAKAVFGLAIGFFGQNLPAKFDCSSIRRRIDSFDEQIRAAIDAPL
jgi:hypothetical protein